MISPDAAPGSKTPAASFRVRHRDTMTAPIALFDVKSQQALIRPELDRRIAAVLDSGRFINGPEVAELEEKLAAFAGCAHAVGVSSGTDALQIAMRLKAIADPVRVKIVSYLYSSSAGEESSGELAAVLELSESTISHHLGQLRKAGLVVSDRRGMNVFHRVRPEALQALCVVLDPNCCT